MGRETCPESRTLVGTDSIVSLGFDWTILFPEQEVQCVVGYPACIRKEIIMAGDDEKPETNRQPHLSKQDINTLVSYLIL